MTQKKHVRFVQTRRGDDHASCSSRGLKDTKLHVLPPPRHGADVDAAPQTLEGEPLAALVKVDAELEDSLVILERSGLNLDDVPGAGRTREGLADLPRRRSAATSSGSSRGKRWTTFRASRSRQRSGHELVVADETRLPPSGRHRRNATATPPTRSASRSCTRCGRRSTRRWKSCDVRPAGVGPDAGARASPAASRAAADPGERRQQQAAAAPARAGRRECASIGERA